MNSINHVKNHLKYFTEIFRCIFLINNNFHILFTLLKKITCFRFDQKLKFIQYSFDIYLYIILLFYQK